MPSRRVLTAVLFGAALVVLSGCGTTNPVASTGSALDSTPPAAPQNLKASLDAGALVLTWDASADADVQGYDVYRYAPDPSRENAYVKMNPSLVTDTQYTVPDARPRATTIASRRSTTARTRARRPPPSKARARPRRRPRRTSRPTRA